MTELDLSAEQAAEVARRAIPLLDLTDLSDACRESAVDALCRTAREAEVAAVCVWPAFVGQALRGLHGTSVKVATVINFPAGGDDIERAVDDTGEALADGAHEIDLVMPYSALMRGERRIATEMVATVREACDRGRILKVILESGELVQPATIAEASRLALDGGADFVKTSTGKTAVSATPEAAETMLRAIRDAGRSADAGLKVSGGLRSVADAAGYLALADRVMGPGWVSPDRFRIGASGLYAELARALAPRA